MELRVRRTHGTHGGPVRGRVRALVTQQPVFPSHPCPRMLVLVRVLVLTGLWV